jgi:hypothetical protein
VSGHASNVGELARESVEFPPFGPRLLNKRRGFFYAEIHIHRAGARLPANRVNAVRQSFIPGKRTPNKRGKKLSALLKR